MGWRHQKRIFRFMDKPHIVTGMVQLIKDREHNYGSLKENPPSVMYSNNIRGFHHP